jgi:hypothetical protein
MKRLQERIDELAAQNQVLEKDRAQLADALQRLHTESREQSAALTRDFQQQLATTQQSLAQMQAAVTQTAAERDLALQQHADSVALLQQFESALQAREQLRLQQQTNEWSSEHMGDVNSAVDSDIVLLQEKKILQLLQEIELLQTQLHAQPSLLAEARVSAQRLSLQMQATAQELEMSRQNTVVLFTQLEQEAGRAERLMHDISSFLQALQTNTLQQYLERRRANEVQYRVDAAIGQQTRDTLALFQPILQPEAQPSAAHSQTTTEATTPDATTTHSEPATASQQHNATTAETQAAAPVKSGWFSRIPLLGRLAG